MPRALQPTLKPDEPIGIGFGKEQFDPWWDRVYDKAAINIVIHKSDSDMEDGAGEHKGKADKGRRLVKKTRRKAKKGARDKKRKVR